MKHLEIIEKGIKDGDPHAEIVRKVYLTYPTYAFIGDEEIQYEILNRIATFFSIPINTVQVTGSGKIGRSLHKARDFDPKVSDLDISIINRDLFVKYAEIVYRVTNGLSDGTLFPVNLDVGGSLKVVYCTYLNKGMFRIDLMPTCNERADIRGFFSRLSTDYSSKFKSINASIYLSECFFEMKQRSAIAAHVQNLRKVI